MTAIYILQGIFKTFQNLILAVLKNRVLLLIAIIVLAGVFIAGSYSDKTQASQPEIPAYQKNLPKTEYMGQTQNRVYPIVAYKSTGEKSAELLDYYSYEAGKWVRFKSPLPVQNIEITKR